MFKWTFHFCFHLHVLSMEKWQGPLMCAPGKNRKYHTVDITPEPNIKCNGISDISRTTIQWHIVLQLLFEHNIWQTWLLVFFPTKLSVLLNTISFVSLKSTKTWSKKWTIWMFVPTTPIYTHGLGLSNNPAFLHNKH
jgi:hypothetical protein